MMPKHTTPISINNRTFKINTLHLEAVAHKYFDISFQDCTSAKKSEIKDYVRNLVKNKEHLSAQIIEDAIFLDFLPKNLQKDLKSLAYLHG
jgi:predicted nucleic acid-binding OB-fold protein